MSDDGRVDGTTTSVRTEGYGQLVVYRYEQPLRIVIPHADPRIKVDAKMLHGIRLGGPGPWVRYDEDHRTLTFTPSDGRRIVYRVLWDTEDPFTRTVTCEWPD